MVLEEDPGRSVDGGGRLRLFDRGADDAFEQLAQLFRHVAVAADDDDLGPQTFRQVAVVDVADFPVVAEPDLVPGQGREVDGDLVDPHQGGQVHGHLLGAQVLLEGFDDPAVGGAFLGGLRTIEGVGGAGELGALGLGRSLVGIQLVAELLDVEGQALHVVAQGAERLPVAAVPFARGRFDRAEVDGAGAGEDGIDHAERDRRGSGFGHPESSLIRG